MSTKPLLSIENLAVSFPASGGDGGDRVRAVNGVNLSVYPEQTLAVVGESGCGKSVTALSCLKLVPTPPGRYDAGRILWQPEEAGDPLDLLAEHERSMQRIRGGQMAMIFQEPMTSLNPVYTIGEQIIEAIRLHRTAGRREAIEIAAEALADVGLADPEDRLATYPHQLSGGMRQRVMIAMALACRPRLLLADEPTTALDVTIQAQILELLRELQRSRGMAVMLITHDLGVVAENADTVAVMYAGRVVEFGSVTRVFEQPQHPYTRGLFRSMPTLGDRRRSLETIPGSVPDPERLPAGCPFHPRCAEMNEDPHCAEANPGLREIHPGHWAACWHAPGHERGRASPPDLDFRRGGSAAPAGAGASPAG